MKQLDRVTLVIIDTKNYAKALISIKKSLSQIKPAKAIFFTDVDITHDGIEVVKIPTIKSKEEYSWWILKELWRYIETDYVLVTQHDGYVLNGESWSDEFYDYDYIGAPWIYEHGRNVGNGGFSLRSKRLCQVLGNDPLIEVTHPEDQSIGIIYRGSLERQHGMKFPEDDLADKFSFELKAPVYDTFGFHGYFHNSYQPVIVIKRIGALGDVVMVEPVLHYFHKRGYKIVLETLPEFYQLFMFHYFKVHHPDEIDSRHMKEARHISLEMGYEVTPEKLHLTSYYDICGIKDGEIRNPKLTLQYDCKSNTSKLFKKSVVLHFDKRPQPSRNVYGVNWEEVVTYLTDRGYAVLQIGQGEREAVSRAVQIQNTNLLLLMRIIGEAELFIGGDSGPSNIAVAMSTPAVILYGSVNPSYIIPDEKNVIAISKHRKETVCSLPYCWSSVIGQEGIECIETSNGKKVSVQMMQGVDCTEVTKDEVPPCVHFDTETVLQSVNKILSIHE
jgi:hypothetical protein